MQSLVQFEKQKFISKGAFVGLERLVMTYVNAISCGNPPCMGNPVLALAQIKNAAAVQKAHDDQQMHSINANTKTAISAINFTSKEKGTSLDTQDREEGCSPVSLYRGTDFIF